jgi:hypothetical protein
VRHRGNHGVRAWPVGFAFDIDNYTCRPTKSQVGFLARRDPRMSLLTRVLNRYILGQTKHESTLIGTSTREAGLRESGKV